MEEVITPVGCFLFCCSIGRVSIIQSSDNSFCGKQKGVVGNGDPTEQLADVRRLTLT